MKHATGNWVGGADFGKRKHCAETHDRTYNPAPNYDHRASCLNCVAEDQGIGSDNPDRRKAECEGHKCIKSSVELTGL
jgi:hypothetical protein